MSAPPAIPVTPPANVCANALKSALAVEPDNADYLYALAVFYLNRGDADRARQMAERLKDAHPASPAGQQILDVIDRKR